MRQTASTLGRTASAQERMRLYDQAFRFARVGAWECDLATERLTWTDGVFDLFGLPVGTRPRRKAIVALYEDESRAEMEALRATALRTGASAVLDARIRTVRGERRWMRLWIQVAMAEGRAVRLFGAKQDVTGEHEALRHLRTLAERDALTGLSNRGTFEAHYRRVVDGAVGEGGVSALALIDLDDFKRVNDVSGHAAGDACLRACASRLRRLFPDAVLVARIGGDEFAILLPAALDTAVASRRLGEACRALARPVSWQGGLLKAGASIGVRFLRHPPLPHRSELFAQADAALYAAKAAGRGTLRVFGDPATSARRAG